MLNREKISALLTKLEQEIKDLEIAYEQYFLGIEKIAPERKRHKVMQNLRKLHTYYIPQTDMRFRLQSISSRFNSYAGYWDRIQRLIEEGRYERHTSRLQRTTTVAGKPPKAEEEKDPIENLYSDLVTAHQDCKMTPPRKEQVASFLEKQKSAIREKFGDRQVDFVVVTDGGKPKIKVKARR